MSGPTLVEFLTARLDEDEAATAHASEVGEQYTVASYGNGLHDIGGEDWLGGLRIDTARVLADVKAKRAIVALHSGSHECSGYDHTGEVDNCQWITDGDCSTNRLLASVFADRSDYDATWAP